MNGKELKNISLLQQQLQNEKLVKIKIKITQESYKDYIGMRIKNILLNQLDEMYV